MESNSYNSISYREMQTKISTIEPMYRGYAGILANQLNESQTQVIRKPEMYWQDSSKVCQLKLTLWWHKMQKIEQNSQFFAANMDMASDYNNLTENTKPIGC